VIRAIFALNRAIAWTGWVVLVSTIEGRIVGVSVATLASRKLG
jgi:hypothetical protein